MPSISITQPTADSTVGWTFNAAGSYSTPPSKGGSVAEGDSSVVCTRYDSGGGVIQTGSVKIRGTSGTWTVRFSVEQDYSGCSITAELQLSDASPPYPSATVEGITISS